MLDAVASLVGEIAVPDTGSFAGDVRALLRNAVKLYADDRPSQLFPHLVGEMARNPALADAVRSGFLAQRSSSAPARAASCGPRSTPSSASTSSRASSTTAS